MHFSAAPACIKHTSCESAFIMKLKILPMMQIGFRMNLSLPMTPMYLDRQPADQSLTRYSTPKKATRQISWQKKGQNTFGVLT